MLTSVTMDRQPRQEPSLVPATFVETFFEVH